MLKFAHGQERRVVPRSLVCWTGIYAYADIQPWDPEQRAREDHLNVSSDIVPRRRVGMNEKLLFRISQHRYSAAFCNGGDFPLISFMNKANVRGNLTLFESDIAATKQKGLRYVFG